ncbi:unnamed protein product [Pleuronectes platessa]|uniref:WWE domain-containing protein n=1 Tax=Pleuronectes platessa TaxID=8262 RepID=A0A9N7Y8R5_PLEPL|nr:unnamed protein product [Pleuronectes platessa]
MARPGSGLLVPVNGLGYPPQNLARVVVWEWLNEHGRCRPYSAAVCHHIENVLKGDARGTVVLGQVDAQLSAYVIDLQSMHQFRQDTAITVARPDVYRSSLPRWACYLPSRLGQQGLTDSSPDTCAPPPSFLPGLSSSSAPVPQTCADLRSATAIDTSSHEAPATFQAVVILLQPRLRKGSVELWTGEEEGGDLLEVRREEEQKARWSVFLMESDSQAGGRDNNTGKSVRCAHGPAPSLSHSLATVQASIQGLKV